MLSLMAESATMILIDPAGVPASEQADVERLNAKLEALARRRLERIDILDEPYRRSKTAWKIAMLSNAVTHRFVSLAEGVALSWNHANFLSAVLNGRAMVETAAFYWDFADRFGQLAQISDFAAVDALAMNSLFGTRDEELLRDHPEHKARQILNSIDLIDKTLITGFRSHYDGLSEFCHPNSFGHRGLFSSIDHQTGIASFQSKGGERFIKPIKCALGTIIIMTMALDSADRAIPAFAAAHHAEHPSPLIEDNSDAG
jgi:hypothetical protein